MNEWRLRESTQGKLALYKGNALVADQVMPVLAFPLFQRLNIILQTEPFAHS